MKTRFQHIVLGIVVLLIAPFVVPVFSQYSRINCRQQEVDVLSGFRRDTRYIYWVPVNRTISETPLSGALAGCSRPTSKHQWEYVYTFGPYTRHSPHYIYHSAFSQIRQLQLIWNEFEFDAVERRESAQGLLRDWQALQRLPWTGGGVCKLI
jgi:hypothetical protein